MLPLAHELRITQLIFESQATEETFAVAVEAVDVAGEMIAEIEVAMPIEIIEIGIEEMIEAPQLCAMTEAEIESDGTGTIGTTLEVADLHLQDEAVLLITALVMGEMVGMGGMVRQIWT